MSAILLWGSLLLALFGRNKIRGMAFCAVCVLALNANFYVWLLGKRGMWFALRGIGMHWAYYLYGAVGWIIGRYMPQKRLIYGQNIDRLTI